MNKTIEGFSVNSKPIRLLVVDADPDGLRSLRNILEEVQGIEIVGVARTKRGAIKQLKVTGPDMLLADLMLPENRSIELIRYTENTHPQCRVLAVSQGDSAYDKIILAMQAGAMGYVTRDSTTPEFMKAIHTVIQGKHWMPLEETYDVLQAAAPELEISSRERRDRLAQIVLGLIPLAGLLAAITAYLWREYWGQIGVRVVDLGVDPTTRMTDVLVTFLLLLGLFGPLLFVPTWTHTLGEWVADRDQIRIRVDKWRYIQVGFFKPGQIIFRHWAGLIWMTLLILSITFLLSQYVQLVVIMVIGPLVALIVLANIMGFDVTFPGPLRLPKKLHRRALLAIGVLPLFFMIILSVEVFVLGPDLQKDGVHGILVPRALDVSAKPVRVFDREEQNAPFEALYLGGNADLYVLYDPCTEVVRFVSVGSSEIEYIDEVNCSDSG